MTVIQIIILILLILLGVAFGCTLGAIKCLQIATEEEEDEEKSHYE